MRKIRVLVVDDAVVVRRIVSEVLRSDPDLEVAGTAATGAIALAKIPQVNPDVVTLDVEMPEMDGLQTLAAIRKHYPHLPVIMFSSLTERGAGVTLDALTLGAADYVTKPAGGGMNAAAQRVREQLIPRIKLFGRPSAEGDRSAAPACARAARQSGPLFARPSGSEQPSCASRVDIVAIGVSTGGPNALAALLPTLAPSLSVPVVIVQHMPPTFTRLLAGRLAAQTGLPIAEGVSGDSLEPGRIWIAPGDHHVTVTRTALGGKLQLHQGPPENSCRPAADVLFRSAAEAYGRHVLAVVLTGMGQDGLRGCEAVHDAGGQVVVQDEDSSVVWGMPGFVARAGLAQRILPLTQIGPEIVRRTGAARRAASSHRL